MMLDWKLFSKKTKPDPENWNVRTMFGPNLSFAATEAYKLLRTNIKFAFAEESGCHVVGIASSVQSEGKSSTACNLAYSLAEAGNKVLLLEGDLRRPTLATKLGLAKTPGITNWLIFREDYHDAIQQCEYAPNMDIITSGDIPPNPAELLSSERMEVMVNDLKEKYEYIIFDLPPITAVADALAISKLLDGVVMTVKAGATDQWMLEEAMRQIKQVNLRVLGFVYRESGAGNARYSARYGKYSKYSYYYNSER